MKNLFSERHNYKKIQDIEIETMPPRLRKRLWNVIREFIEASSYRNEIIERVWDEFYKEDKDKLQGTTTYV